MLGFWTFNKLIPVNLDEYKPIVSRFVLLYVTNFTVVTNTHSTGFTLVANDIERYCSHMLKDDTNASLSEEIT